MDTDPQNFVFLAEDLPEVGPKYQWNNYDRAYEEYGNYVSDISNRSSVISDNKITDDHLSGGFRAGFAVKSNPEQEKYNQKQQHDDLRISINSPKITHFPNSSSIFTVNTKNTIPSKIFPVNNITFDNLFNGPKLGVIIAAPNHPAERLLSKEDSALNQGRLKNLSTQPSYQEKNLLVNQAYAAENTDSSTSSNNLAIQQFNNFIYYPFRSLFTGRKQEELEFEINESTDYISFTTRISTDLKDGKLVIPELNPEETMETDQNDLSKKTEKVPQVFWDGELIQIPPQPINCDQFNQGEMVRELLQEEGFQFARFTSISSGNCLDFDLPNLTQKIGYLVTVENRNIEGKSLLFSVINKNSQRSDLETYLPKKLVPSPYTLAPNISYFIIPPMEEFGQGYTLHFDNISIGRVKTINDLGRITVNPIPYRFLTGLKIVKGKTDLSTSEESLRNTSEVSYSVEHPNPSFYKIQFNNLTIEQFSNGTIVIFYLPQYLAYLGFGLLFFYTPYNLENQRELKLPSFTFLSVLHILILYFVNFWESSMLNVA